MVVEVHAGSRLMALKAAPVVGEALVHPLSTREPHLQGGEAEEKGRDEGGREQKVKIQEEGREWHPLSQNCGSFMGCEHFIVV